MLKMDFLGLKTLTVIHDAVQMIARAHRRATSTWTRSTFDDPEGLRAAARGPHGRRLPVRVAARDRHAARHEVRPVRRSGRVERAAAPGSARRGDAQGLHPAEAGAGEGHLPAPALEEILEPTYGVITYQEQVMRIAQRARRLHPGRSRRAPEGGGQEGRGADQEGARQVRRAGDGAGPPEEASSRRSPAQIETFGRYGFNKSHSVAYSVISYQTAWLKAHYPAEFMAALLSSEIGDTDNVVKYINEARELGLEVLPPDVNESGYKFTVVGDKRIRFGLGAIRNVGRGAIDSIIAARQDAPFTTLFDFVERIDLRLCNKRVFEALIAAGACDALGGHRAQLCEALDRALQRGAAAAAGDARPARRRCSARRRRTGARAATRRARCPTSRPGPRPSGWRRRRRCSASTSPATRSSRSATRSSCSAPAPPRRWASGARPVTLGGRGHGGQAADHQEDGHGVRAADGRGLSRHRGGARLSRTPGPSSTGPSCPTRPCCSPAATATATRARTTRRSSSKSRPAAGASSRRPGAVALSLRWRAPAARRPDVAPGGGRALLGAPGPDAALY